MLQACDLALSKLSSVGQPLSTLKASLWDRSHYMTQYRKFAPLGDWLSTQHADQVVLTIADIEQLVGPLGRSALTPQFWANTKHHASRRSQWLDNGYHAYFRPKENSVEFKRVTARGAGWTDRELVACIGAYRMLWDAQNSGETINKSELRRKIVSENLSARGDGAYERRMQNISAVIEELGLDFVKG
jgi:hypothetical protein